MVTMLLALPPTFAANRQAVHAIAEMVLGVARYGSDGEVGLRPVDGGLATPPLGPEGLVVGVVGTDLVRWRGDGPAGGVEEARQPVTTLRAAAAFAGVEAGVPGDLWPPETSFGLDEPLPIDADGAAALAEWYRFSSAVLAGFAAGAAGDDLQPVTLWPEHFDLATHDNRAANYGGSPGDAPTDEPYLYVGPWARPLPPAGEGFWNRAFGAALTYADIESVDAAVRFLQTGRAFVVDAGRN
jgi:hypothetical protein